MTGRLAPGETRKIAVATGAQLAVAVSGTLGKPVVIFSNSLAADMTSWDEVEQCLRPHALMVRYDTRGHGASDVVASPYRLSDLGADVLALMDALAIERATICGLSLGGITAMWLGIHAPTRVSGLIVANTATNFPPSSMWRERAGQARTKTNLEDFVQPTLERWFTGGFRASYPECVARVGSVIANTSPLGYAGACDVLAEADVSASVQTITAPVRVIVGRYDPSTPPARGIEIVNAIENATLVTLDAAHLSAIEAYQGFADTVTKFIEQQRQP